MADSPILEPGTQAPGFCLPNAEGTEVRLDDLRGQWVVLYFYPKDNTPGCTLEAKEFSELQDQFTSLGAVILGVSSDSVKSHRNFMTKHNLGVGLLSDAGHEVLEAFGAWRLKKNYGREYMGVVRSTVLIDPKGIVRHVWPEVKAAGHAAAVLGRLAELASKQK